jgi:hypothetical protein
MNEQKEIIVYRSKMEQESDHFLWKYGGVLCTGFSAVFGIAVLILALYAIFTAKKK